ncbi:YaaC family protein [Martelella mangrovi]|uniref:YaaC-like protein n=1 Tax=Martelella mangrovi TaxID=1397477 RepID=A0ABV2IHS8_9HYPH
MEEDVWQSLLNLESRDRVSDCFETIHSRSLNARRAKEIIASARQGREYFKSASTASFAVRPLLAFYGVASLCRCLTLLFRKVSGEEGLTQGHGLETVKWPAILSGDISVALAAVGTLRVRTCGGLFSDLVAATRPYSVLNIYDDILHLPVDGEIKRRGIEISFDDILERLPDLYGAQSRFGTRVKEFRYSPVSGAEISVFATSDHPVCVEYSNAGFKCSEEDNPYDDNSKISILRIDEAGFRACLPQILDTRVKRTMGNYPSPHLVSRFSKENWLSQISVTYITSYMLGMLARYFPTHWSALMGGEKGDGIWPDINAAQRYIEVALPELVLDAVNNALFMSEKKHDKPEM